MIYRAKLSIALALVSLQSLLVPLKAQTVEQDRQDPAPGRAALQAAVHTARELADIALNTHAELSDFELALMAGQGLRGGDKRDTYTYTLRVCEVIERRGSGTFVTSFRAKAQHCSCESGFELQYGTTSDRGLQAVSSVSTSTFGYLAQNCRHSTQVFP